MLLELHIENFTIIERATLQFGQGMTVITGETGAGKSIGIDALSWVLGSRADSKMLRPGSDKADITAVFQLSTQTEAAQWLAENDLSTEQECILRRVVHNNGRSQAYINHKPCTLQQQKALGSLLVNIHGQHEHHALLQRSHQRQRLDHFAGADPLAKQVHEHYHAWQSAEQQLHALQTQQANHATQQALIDYQLAELTTLNLGENELDELHQQQKQLANASAMIGVCQHGVQQLKEAEQGAMLDELYKLQQAIAAYSDVAPALQNAHDLLSEACTQIEEATHTLQHFVEKLDTNPEQLHTIEQRLEHIYDTARKQQVDATQLYAHWQTLQQQTADHQDLDQALIAATETAQQTKAAFFAYAAQLSTKRQHAATELAKKVTESLQALGIQGGKFAVQLHALSEDKANEHGLEHIAFHVSTNPGQPLQTMSNVVSGGELSRLSLAIQVLTAAHQATPTLIFDEVDVGIGGATAEIVGKLLRQLSAHCQLLCVTHLPQVAAQGQHHIHVNKVKTQQDTFAEVTQLNTEQRTQELARMLGGVNITDQTLAHAQEMLNLANV